MYRLLFSLIIFVPMLASAQIGDHRNDLAVGVNGGYTMSNVGFSPNVPQKNLGGATAGLTIRYTCEKYFKSIFCLKNKLDRRFVNGNYCSLKSR